MVHLEVCIQCPCQWVGAGNVVRDELPLRIEDAFPTSRVDLLWASSVRIAFPSLTITYFQQRLSAFVSFDPRRLSSPSVATPYASEIKILFSDTYSFSDSTYFAS